MTDRDGIATPELDADDPIDPDIALITDWLAHELSPEDEAMVETRLENDFEFFEKVAPVMDLWHDPVLVSELTARAEADTNSRISALERTARPQGLEPPPPRQVREASPRSAAIAPEENALPAIDARSERQLRRKEFMSNLYHGALFVYSIAATYLIIFGLPTQMYVKATATPHDKVITRTEWTPTQPTLPHGVLVQTNATETKEIPLRGGSKVVLRPGSRFTYEYIPMSMGVMAVLDGEAAINLSQGDKHMVLKTSAGGVLMTQGSYAVRCEPSCTAMLLTVGTGLAMIRHDSAKVGLSLKTGEKGMLPRGGGPEKVEPGQGWPALEPAVPAEGGRGGAGASAGVPAKRHS